MNAKEHAKDLKEVLDTVKTLNELIACLELKKYQIVKQLIEGGE